MDELLKQYETDLWQIQRMHNWDIKVGVELTPDYGDIYYSCTLTVCGRSYYSQGRNLWKRYREFVKVLTRLYSEEDLYRYGAKPMFMFPPVPPQPGETERITSDWYVRLTIGSGLKQQYQYWFRKSGQWIAYPLRDMGRGDWYIDKAVEKLLTLPQHEQQRLTMEDVGPLASAIRQRYQQAHWASQNSPIGGGKTLKGIKIWIDKIYQQYGP
ncbi:hypothetical protein FAES_4039 [Fibrella aestuarina BUZ 2]|uniref:Uncharacterized protein n=1 Tax=Fibrella aestuarina BUZ 2 TaxID=1166018 RepID=I0KD36_9BACT|nr:hypothetical protein [Fibrella aestuarina]CCH02039.1 hypothetical protein FAES_4039 [Fibrella aestuarina BUZ 2]